MKTEGHKRFLKEEEDWRYKRKAPDSDPLYTWEDMYSMEQNKDIEIVWLAIFAIIIVFILSILEIILRK